MDEISTGLDSAATFDIIVMMLNEGRVMYYGPGEEALGYFEGLGFKRPPQRDVADFLMDLGNFNTKLRGTKSSLSTGLC